MQGSRGASLVELGRFAEGKTLLAPLIDAEPPFDAILSRLFLARAEHGLGATAEARKLVETARTALAASPHTEAQLLLRRVESGLGPPPAA